MRQFVAWCRQWGAHRGRLGQQGARTAYVGPGVLLSVVHTPASVHVEWNSAAHCFVARAAPASARMSVRAPCAAWRGAIAELARVVFGRLGPSGVCRCVGSAGLCARGKRKTRRGELFAAEGTPTSSARPQTVATPATWCGGVRDGFLPRTAADRPSQTANAHRPRSPLATTTTTTTSLNHAAGILAKLRTVKTASVPVLGIGSVSM